LLLARWVAQTRGEKWRRFAVSAQAADPLA